MSRFRSLNCFCGEAPEGKYPVFRHSCLATPCIGVIAAVWLSSPAHAASPAGSVAARNGIEAALARRAHARQTKDLSAYMATFTPGWETINVMGKTVSYALLRRTMATNFASAQKPGLGIIRSRLLSVSAQKHRAVVVVATKFNYPPMQTANGLVYRYRDTVASEVWVKTPAGWQEQRERYLKDTAGVSNTPLTITSRPFPAGKK